MAGYAPWQTLLVSLGGLLEGEAVWQRRTRRRPSFSSALLSFWHLLLGLFLCRPQAVAPAAAGVQAKAARGHNRAGGGRRLHSHLQVGRLCPPQRQLCTATCDRLRRLLLLLGRAKLGDLPTCCARLVCVCRGMFQKETDLALFTGSPMLPCPIVWGAGGCGACLRSTNPPGAMDNLPAPALLHKQPSCPRASLRFHFPCRHARHSCAWQAGGAHRGRVWKVGQVQSLLPGRRPSAAQARPAAAGAARRAAGGRGGTTSAATAAAPGGPLLQAIHV